MSSGRRIVGLAWRGALIASLVPGIVLAVPNSLALLFFVPYAVVGAILVTRRPRNVVGWILVAAGWSFVFVLLEISASAAQLIAGTAGWQNETLAWVTGWTGKALFALFFILTILFPGGRLPAGRRGIAAGVAIGASAALVALASILPVIGVTPKGARDGINVPNPFALLHGGIWDQVQPGMLAAPAFAALVAGVLLMLIRFARAQGLERQQLRWLVTSLALITVAVVGGLVTVTIRPDAVGVAWIPASIAFPMLPVAVGVAVLRYRLYELDVIISRTLVYGSVTVVLAAGFGLANIALQRLLEVIIGQRSDLIAGAMGGVGATLAFGPLRRTMRSVVDRFLPSRAVLTLLFTDIVGSTEHIVELGDERWRMLLGRYRAAVRQELARKSGHEVDTAGDAFFATFDRPSSGVNCAWTIRSAVEELGLQTRTGVHLGECEMRGEKVSGIEVHTAARVMATAADGEILLSGAVRDAISSTEFAITDRGRHELRGVPGEWQLYALEVASQAPPATTFDSHAPIKGQPLN